MSLFLMSFLPLCAFAQEGTGTSAVKDITPQALSAILGSVEVIDVNEADNYAFAHVPGARLLPYDAITADVLPGDMATTLVFYCWSPECPAATMAASAAMVLGYTNVYCMQAGITGWQDAGFVTEP
ncbi:MAG: hypothetical protein KDB88_12050 [Flavobacteriales bacterium]|nr:hypothetical protein [Flavobacteriales bacterium]